MLPLTKRTPVSLLHVGDSPILEHQLQALHKAGVKDILVITGFCADQIEDSVRERASCFFNPFFEVCNIAMNLWLVRRELEPDFILLYDDILFGTELIKELTEVSHEVTLVVDRKGIDKEAEKVVISRDSISTIGKDVSNPYGEFIGIARFCGDAVNLLVETLEQIARKDLGATFPQLVNQLIQRGQDIRVLATDRPWYDIDFPRDLEEAQLRFLSNT